MSSYDDCYYKIYLASRLEPKLTIVCMQWFDEDNYYSERFLKDRVSGDILKFDSEEEAKRWLNINIKPEKIDPEYVDIAKIPNWQEEYFK